MKKEHSIRQKLSKSYIVFILIFILFVGLLSNVVIQKQFNDYAIKKREHEISDLMTRVTNEYDGSWDIDHIEVISDQAVDDGYIITLKNANKEVVFDANIHNGHQCEMVIDGIIKRMKESNPYWNGEFRTHPYEIKDTSGKLIGYLDIGYLTPYFYTEEDLVFINTLNTVYLLATLVFIVLALWFASYMAKRLSRPINKMVLASSNISQGIYEQIPPNNENILELNELTNSMNKLSSSLKKQEDLRKQLTSDITHELRTPLTTLQTHIEAMIDGVYEVNEEQLQSIYEEILRLGHLVNDLDELAKFDQKEMELSFQKVNLGSLIKKVLTIYQGEFQQKQIELDYLSTDTIVSVDTDKMSQVFINLISNALKYTPKYGKVQVLCKEEKNHIVIKIIDNGEGISAEDLPHIFERLYRADKSRNRQTGGSGIGLSIVKSIVLAHNGQIDVESTVNKGTTILIRLPKD